MLLVSHFSKIAVLYCWMPSAFTTVLSYILSISGGKEIWFSYSALTGTKLYLVGRLYWEFGDNEREIKHSQYFTVATVCSYILSP